MKKIVLIFALFVIGIGLSSCGESSVTPVENNQESELTEQQTETEDNEGHKEEKEEPKELSIGDTIDFDGLHITLNSVEKYEGDGQWEKPDNDFFVILDMTLENTTDEAKNVSTLMQMELVDADGYSYDLSIMVDTKGSLDGEVGPGRKKAGQIAFDVEESEYYEFIFDDPFTSGQAIWKIDLNK